MKISHSKIFKESMFITICIAISFPAHAFQPKPNFKNMQTEPQSISFAEADKRFQLSKINFSFDPSQLKRIKKVTLFEGDTRLETLDGNDVEGDFIVVNGNLIVDGEVRFSSNESMLGMVVLGNANMKTLVMDFADLKVTKGLKVTDYIHLQRPVFEQGALSVDGLVETKYLIQEDINPSTWFGDESKATKQKFHFISEDKVKALHKKTKLPLKNKIFNESDGRGAVIKDMAAFIKLIEGEKNKDEQQK
jgi:hypothetical protein